MTAPVPTSLSEYRRRLEESSRRPPGGPIDIPPSGPQPPDMEARVAKLEADMSEVKSDLKSLLKDVSEIKGRIASMPTAWQLLGMNLTIVLAVMGATFAIIRFGLG